MYLTIGFLISAPNSSEPTNIEYNFQLENSTALLLKHTETNNNIYVTVTPK